MREITDSMSSDKKHITILAIESSCDDTSAAVIRDGLLLSNVTASQKVHEEYGGVVPELASRAHQVNIVPVSEKFSDYAKKVCEFLNNYEIRASVDDRNETLGKRIRESELKRIPFLVIVGEKEESEGSVSVRRQGGIDQGSMPLKDFAELVAGEVKAQLA